MSSKKEIQTILVIIIGFLILYAVFRWQGFWIMALIIGIPGLLIPSIRSYIVKGWFRLAKMLGFINARIILSIIYFVLLCPLAFVSRLFSKDKFQFKKKKSAQDSYYTVREQEYNAEDFKNPW